MVRTERLIEDLWADEAVGHGAQHAADEGVAVAAGAWATPRSVTGTQRRLHAGGRPGRGRCARGAFAWPNRPQRSEAPATRPPRCETCATALAMFGGDILSGAGEGEWVIPHRARLEEVRLGLLEDQLAARLDLGASGDVIGELEALVRAAPAARGLVGAADGRLVPRRPPGRCAGDVPAGQDLVGRRARPRPWTRSCSSSSSRSSSTTRRSASPVRRSAASRRTGRPGTCRRCPRSSSAATTEVAAVVDLRRPTRGSSRSSGRAASARRRWRSRPAARSARSDGVGARRRLAGQTRDRGDCRRRGRHVGRRAERGRRGGAARAAQEQPPRWSSSTTASTSSTPPRLSPSGCSTPRPGCGSSAPARSRSTSTVRSCSSSRRSRSSDAVALFTVGPSAQRTNRASSAGGRRRAGPVPVARWSAPGDRARRGTNEDAVDRGDHPPPRRSVQRAERSDQPPTGTPPGAQVDDPVELRAAVPRRPAGPVGPRHLRRRRPAPRGRVRPRSARRAGGRGDRRGRPAREPVAGDRRRRRRADRRSATGCSTASGRSRSRR